MKKQDYELAIKIIEETCPEIERINDENNRLFLRAKKVPIISVVDLINELSDKSFHFSEYPDNNGFIEVFRYPQL